MKILTFIHLYIENVNIFFKTLYAIIYLFTDSQTIHQLMKKKLINQDLLEDETVNALVLQYSRKRF